MRDGVIPTWVSLLGALGVLCAIVFPFDGYVVWTFLLSREMRARTRAKWARQPRVWVRFKILVAVVALIAANITIIGISIWLYFRFHGANL